LLATSAICLRSVINDPELYHRVWVGSALIIPIRREYQTYGFRVVLALHLAIRKVKRRILYHFQAGLLLDTEVKTHSGRMMVVNEVSGEQQHAATPTCGDPYTVQWGPIHTMIRRYKHDVLALE
jgi:hypothetical protein